MTFLPPRVVLIFLLPITLENLPKNFPTHTSAHRLPIAPLSPQSKIENQKSKIASPFQHAEFSIQHFNLSIHPFSAFFRASMFPHSPVSCSADGAGKFGSDESPSCPPAEQKKAAQQITCRAAA
jgi:hypothetical protein